MFSTTAGAIAFLDRDGVINEKADEGDYVKSPAEFRMLPGAPEAIRALNEQSVRVVVVTNQRGIALGRMTEEDVAGVHRRMEAELAEAGAHVDAVLHCPHDHGVCDCRKPGTGMFREALRRFPGTSVERAVVIGDARSDMEAAHALGARAILVRADDADVGVPVEHRAASLADAVAYLRTAPL